MKIGILTYHRAENYGALLQAYATKTYLHSLGHEVSFVDYWPHYHSNYFKLFSWRKFKKVGLTGKLVMLINLMPPRILRKKRLQRFMLDSLHLPKLPCYVDPMCKTEEYDVAIYGSDQIWRKQKLEGVGFDSWYFGAENVLSKKKVAYAASMGAIETTGSEDEFVRKMMKNFSSISVREQDLQHYLGNLGISATIVSDPVFLLSRDEWKKIETHHPNNCSYILFYNLLNSAESVRFAEMLSRETGLPIKEVNKQISVRRLGKRYVNSASVEYFLQLIDEADYVVSNSFHGVAFSIIFEKQFFAVGMGQKANRVVSLLESLEIGSRYYCDSVSKICLDDAINYKKINARLSKIVLESKNYLNYSIGQ